MADLHQQLVTINTKLQQLLKQYDLLQKEHEKNKMMIAELELQQEEEKKLLADLQQQNLILKASLQSLDPTEKKELELKLSQYIKNIDKSISLLSQ